MRVIDPSEVSFETDRKPLHSGLDGTVALARLSGELVAVKRFVIRNSQSVTRFEREAAVLELEKLRRVVRPVGLVRSAPHYWLVLPFYSNGDLGKFSKQEDGISLSLALCLCRDAADALSSVNELGLVFRDFKSANVLVGDDLQARLTDFGSVQDVSRGILKEENEMGPSGGFHKRLMEGTTLLYAAPEVVSLESRNELHLESDVYSLGITMCEILTRHIPYETVVKDIPAMNTVMDATYNEQSLLSAICVSNLRPPFDKTRFDHVKEQKVLQEWKDLIQECWAGKKEERPGCKDVVSRLETLIKTLGIDADAARASLLSDLSGDSNGSLNGNPKLKAQKLSIPPPPLLEIQNRVTADPAPLSIGGFATSGRRGPDKMEDRHWVSHAQLADGQVVTVILVLDGHGGQGAAQFAVEELGPAIHQGLQEAGNDVSARCRAISKAFLDTDARFQALHADDKSGSTALALVIYTGDGKVSSVITANAGDCRAVVAERVGQKYLSKRLTNDHNADQPEERKRVEAAGARVVVDAQGYGRVQGHIQVTRSLGDIAMKEFGVTAEPEIEIFEVVPGMHDFMVIGTDGLFDFMKDDEVIRGVLDTAKDAGLAAKRLGSESIAKGSTDNVTNLVVYFREWDSSGKADWE